MHQKRYFLVYLLCLVFVTASLAAKENTPPKKSAYITQPSFVNNGGMLRRNEHALLVYADTVVLPPAIMLGYRYGLSPWLNAGIDVGGNYGVFQALLNLKLEIFKTGYTELFFWAVQFKTGYKYHKAEFTEEFIFDDNSWIFSWSNTFAFRFGDLKNRVLSLSSQFYIDKDLHEPVRQTDYYLAPLIAGYESTAIRHLSIFINAGWMISLNGMETYAGILYDKQSFPIAEIGVAVRTQ